MPRSCYTLLRRMGLLFVQRNGDLAPTVSCEGSARCSNRKLPHPRKSINIKIIKKVMCEQ